MLISRIYNYLLCDVEVWPYKACRWPRQAPHPKHPGHLRKAQQPETSGRHTSLRSGVSCGYGSKVGYQRAYQIGTVTVVFCIEPNQVRVFDPRVLPGSCAASTSSVGDNVDAIRKTYGTTTVRNSLPLSTSRPETRGSIPTWSAVFFFKKLVDGHWRVPGVRCMWPSSDWKWYILLRIQSPYLSVFITSLLRHSIMLATVSANNGVV